MRTTTSARRKRRTIADDATEIRPWAKPGARGKDFHCWYAHAIDVAETLRALLSEDTIRRRLAGSAGIDDLTAVDVARLCVLAYFHDTGKLCPGFVGRNIHGWPEDRRANHREAAVAMMNDPDASASFMQAIDFDAVAEWFGGNAAAEDMILAAFSHHGVPEPAEIVNAADARRLARAWRTYESPDGRELHPGAWLMDAGRKVREAFPEAWTSGPGVPATPAFQDHFAGLLAVADWIASTRDHHGETWFAPARDDAGRGPTARAAARRAVHGVGLVGTPAPQGRRVTGEAVIGAEPNRLQKAVEELPLPDGGSLAALEAQTGSGKTEAMLVWFMRLHAAGLVSGLYIALPTRAAATQIHARVTAILKRCMGIGAPPCVLAVPGYARVDDRDGQPDGKFSACWRDGGDASTWPAESPRRFLAAPIAVGTIDQALAGTIAAPHASTREALLAHHLIAIDEVHASDQYVSELTAETVERQRARGGHAVVMSATLGSWLRSTLFGDPLPSLDEATRDPYPVVRLAAGRGATSGIYDAGPGIRRRVRVEAPEIIGDTDAIARRAFNAAKRGARALVIVNTVERALAVHAAVEELAAAAGRTDIPFSPDGVPAPHHSRFAAEDRPALDEAASAALSGSASGRARGRILVSTQTMEQSVDVDADILFTDLAPLDVIIQRLGRLHRHADPARPKGFRRPHAVVAVPSGDMLQFRKGPKHGLGSAYPDLRALHNAREFLSRRTSIRFPEEARTAVEETVHPDALNAVVRERGGAWYFQTAENNNAELIGENEARNAVRDVANGFATHEKIRFTERSGPSGKEGEAHRARTRLGANDVEASLRRPATGPFGRKVRTFRIPERMAPADPDEPMAVLAEDWGAPGRLLIRYGHVDAGRTTPLRLVYERTGLRRTTAEEDALIVGESRGSGNPGNGSRN